MDKTDLWNLTDFLNSNYNVNNTLQSKKEVGYLNAFDFGMPRSFAKMILLAVFRFSVIIFSFSKAA